MKLAFIGASHWHLPLYLEPAMGVPGAKVIGVSDPDPNVVGRLKATLGCGGSTDFRELCERERPDFVFALGRHCDMADEASYLIDAGIPFAIEKPCGVSSDEVGRIARLSRERGAFAAVPFVFRNGELLQMLQEMAGNDGYQVMSFRFIAGFPTRYLESGCAWMLDPALSGGGTTINLSVHFFDLCRILMGEDSRVVSAAMSNAAWRFPVEDHSCVTLQAPGGICQVESGYLFPAPTSTFDLHYSIRSPDAYIVVHDRNTVEIFDRSGKAQRRNVSSTNVPHYRDFVHDVLARVSSGRPPLASLDDMLPVMRIVEEAYERVRTATGADFNCRARQTISETTG